MKYCSLVNIKQGSRSEHRFSNGNTLPLTQLPFAMAAFAPQTSSKNSWFYHPEAKSLEGVRLTHQPSPWIGDYGSLVFMPQKFKPEFSADRRWSGYRPKDAVLTPYYIKLRFLRSRADLELTPTQRGGAVRIRFDDEKENYFSFHTVSGYGSFDYDEESGLLYAKIKNCNDKNARHFCMYVVAHFHEGQISANQNKVCNSRGVAVSNVVRGNDSGIVFQVLGKNVDVEIATSYISFSQAVLNWNQEFEGKTFDIIKNEGELIWESYLSRVEAECYSKEQQKTFYSCLYRAFLYPHKCYELNEQGLPIHYSPSDGKIRNGVRYTDNGFWDTYRTVYPFFSLVAKKEYAEMVQGFVNDYLESGWLPRWPSIAERGCMPSTLIDAVLCDAAVKGLMDEKTMENALNGMIKHSRVDSDNDDFGRSGAGEYLRLGYVPIEAHLESVNLTLDAAYGDWCIARIAELLHKPEIVKEYDQRAENYKNLFDPKTGFMRAKYRNGEFRTPFSPTGWGLDYTEGSAWQNSFAVPHDIEGLAELYGSKEALMAKIDLLFSTPPVYEDNRYGCEIHEMTEMAAADFGQCAISNQPSFHIPYIYSALGNVKKTSYWVEKMCRELFSSGDDGFPGDEDNGSMALWYIFSSIGIYPFTPGKKEFVRTKKLVKSVKILGKDFDADAFSASKILYEDVLGL